MPSPQRAAVADTPAASMPKGMIPLFAFCCGAIVANLYYAQPVISLIAPDIGMSPLLASLIVSLTQIGYALGLFFLVPLGDLLENRRLMMITVSVCILSLAGAALATSPPVFLLASLLIGFSSVAVQIIVPLAAHLAPEASRGRVVGGIMSGLLLGILLARPMSSFIAGHVGWRAVFAAAAALMAGILLVFAAKMPTRQPQHQGQERPGYAQLLRSLGSLMAHFGILRQRALYQACMFASFSLFWTAAPLELARTYGFSQGQIALFCLAGAVGAIAAPIGGRLADAGHTRAATRWALAGASLSYLPALSGSAWGFVGLTLTGILLDFCVQMNMVLGQRDIYGLDPTSRGRLNALYMTSIFVGGAAGSSVASSLYGHGGWMWIALIGAGIPLLALVRQLAEARTQ